MSDWIGQFVPAGEAHLATIWAWSTASALTSAAMQLKTRFGVMDKATSPSQAVNRRGLVAASITNFQSGRSALGWRVD